VIKERCVYLNEFFFSQVWPVLVFKKELDSIPSAWLRTGISYDIKYRICLCVCLQVARRQVGKALFSENDEETEEE